MAKFEDVFKDELNKIDFAQDEKDNIRNQVIRKYKRKKIRDYSILCIVSLTITCLIGFGIVYAEEIENFIEDFTISIRHTENGSSTTTVEMREVRKVMNYDADIPVPKEHERFREYKLDELEELLGFKILKSDLFDVQQVLQIGTTKEDGKIANAEFDIKGQENKKEIPKWTYMLYVSFSTIYDKEYSNYKCQLTSNEEVPSTEYYIKNLGVKARIFNSNNTNFTVIFIYDDVVYTFHFRKFIDIDHQNDKQIRNLLETFSLE